LQDIQDLLPASEDSILALDLETNGTDFSDPACYIVGIGLADRNACLYLNWSGLSGPARQYLFAQLRRRPLTSFNVLFDGGFLWKQGLGWLNWSMCTFGLFRQLATEGYNGQTWKLETFMRDVLGWEVSSKAVMAEALARHKLTKETMWRLATIEPHLFGTYCALDAEAHLQAFEALADVIEQLGKPGQALKQYHTKDFLVEVKLLIEQQIRGSMLDVPKAQTYHDKLGRDIEAGLAEFLALEETAPAIAEYNMFCLEKVLGKEPAKLTTAGKVSLNWSKWQARVKEAQLTNYFNSGSSKQLAWLFYDKLGYAPKKFTDGGSRSTDREVLPFLGAPGKLLSKVKKMQKEQMYVAAGLAKQRDGIIHHACKSVGTVTGRLSGGYEDV